MSEIIQARRDSASQRLSQLEQSLSEAAKLAEGKAAVYVTGSFGRGEASSHSDLDLFIVGKSLPSDNKQGRALKRLDEICVEADLVRAIAKLGFPPFSGDGEWLAHYTIPDLIGKLGTPHDDVLNTFTARLLLLLESRALIGVDIREQAINETIDAYWRDYEKHKSDFVPAFLTNDILRLWRTFCVNYEARTKSEPAEQRAKRKLKNYKLKHSRLLTCYSALLHLLAVFAAKGTVDKEAAVAMTRLTPMERIAALPAADAIAVECKAKLVACYEKFLLETDASESDLLDRFMDAERSRAYSLDAREMGDAVHDLLQIVGADSRFYRLLVV